MAGTAPPLRNAACSSRSRNRASRLRRKRACRSAFVNGRALFFEGLAPRCALSCDVMAIVRLLSERDVIGARRINRRRPAPHFIERRIEIGRTERGTTRDAESRGEHSPQRVVRPAVRAAFREEFFL